MYEMILGMCWLLLPFTQCLLIPWHLKTVQ